MAQVSGQGTQNPASVSSHCLLYFNRSPASGLRGQESHQNGLWPLPIQTPGSSLPHKKGVHALGWVKEEGVTHQIQQPKT